MRVIHSEPLVIPHVRSVLTTPVVIVDSVPPFVDPYAETAPIIGGADHPHIGAAPVNLPVYAPDFRAYPRSSFLSERLLWQGYGMDDDL